MKKILLCLLCQLLFVSLFAQTQQGVVKTRGRMVNGVLQPGRGLAGATVNLAGRQPVVSKGTGGNFSFPVSGQKFRIVKVQKQGYQLVDDGACTEYKYSENPLRLVMETPEQQMEDQLEAEEKISRTLREQLKKSRQEIQRLKDENKITEEDYRQKIAKLMENQKNNKDLITEMAKEYSQMDYDNMDDKNRKICDAILNGRLKEADSLLRSKGDVNTRIFEVRKAQQAEAEEEAELAQRQNNLVVSKEGTKKKLEDIARDCKNYYDRFKMANQHDSASYYIELRAALDTTIAEWLFEAGKYFQEQNQYAKSKYYYIKALRIREEQVSNAPTLYEHEYARTLNNLGLLYISTGDFTYSESMLLKAISIRRKIGETHLLAGSLANLAILRQTTERFSESESCYLEALDIHKRLAKENPQTYEPAVAKDLTSLAGLYGITNRYKECEELCLEALSIQQLMSSDKMNCEPQMARTMSYLAELYVRTQRFSEGEKLFMDALNIYDRLAEVNPEAYNLYIALMSSSLSYLYREQNRYNDAQYYGEKSLIMYRELYKENPIGYEVSLASSLVNLGSLYSISQKYAESETMYNEALNIYNRLAKVYPNVCESNIANALNGLAILYEHTHQYSKSEAVYKKVIESFMKLAKDYPQVYEPSVAMSQYNLAEFYANIKRFADAESNYKGALNIYRNLAQKAPQAYTPDVAMTSYKLAKFYFENERMPESEKLYEEAAIILKQLAKTNPQMYERNLLNSLFHLGETRINMKLYKDAITPYEEVLDIYRKKESNEIKEDWQYASSLYWLSRLYSNENQFDKAYRINHDLLPLLEEGYAGDSLKYKYDFSNILGSQSFCCLFLQLYPEAEQYARKGLSIDSTQHWIASNLAAAILFQGKYDEAKKIYQQYKDELKDAFFDDFKQFAEAGVIPKEREADVERIKKLLTK